MSSSNQKSLDDESFNLMVEQTQLQDLKSEIISTLFLSPIPKDQRRFQDLLNAFEFARNSEFIWDVTSVIEETHYKSSAQFSVERSPIKWGYLTFENAHPFYKALHIPNANGADLLIYPNHIVIVNSDTDFGVFPINSLQITSRATPFNEDGARPTDAVQLGTTWTYVNKSGAPDRRFAFNPEIPILQYSEIDFRSKTGYQERIQLSRSNAGTDFKSAFDAYIL